MHVYRRNIVLIKFNLHPSIYPLLPAARVSLLQQITLVLNEVLSPATLYHLLSSNTDIYTVSR